MSGPIPGLWRLSSDDEGTISFEPYVPDVEALAALEHDQWMSWAHTIMDSEPLLSRDRIERWMPYMVPYSELPADIKEFDREWSRKALEVLGIDLP